MEQIIDNRPLRAVLVAADLGGYDTERSLNELDELCKTAGHVSIARVVQRRQSPDPATFVGKGIIEDIAELVKTEEADLIIFDHELSPSQTRNIETACDCPVLDRTLLILNIFAMRATSAEGGIQVELARQRYMLPRLMGKGVELSRMGSGTGTHRGPGETKLESDRRHIRRRIAALEEELRELSLRRDRRRQRRKKEGLATVAIVGYTNAGKSTLLNYLTGAGVLAEDMLFATLDPTSRGLTLPDGSTVLLIDTVGFISRLPTLLIEAFKATLEDASDADLILNICDVSSPDFESQMAVTEGILNDIGAGGVPVVTALNKCDLVSEVPHTINNSCVAISAKTGLGVDRLLGEIARQLSGNHRKMRLLLPYDKGGLLGQVREQGRVITEQYTADGIECEALAHKSIWHLLEAFEV